jgi:hypothetical protein
MVLKLTDNINKIQHVFGLSYNKLLILFSIIFAHGGYDIFVKFNSGLSIYQTNFYYILVIILFYLLSHFSRELFIIIFLGLSIYHFCDDYQYLLQNKNAAALGISIISFTLLNKNGFILWKNTLHFFKINSNLIVYLLYASNLLILYKFIKLIDDRKIVIQYIVILMTIFLLTQFIEPLKFIFYYMLLFHTPLAIYRIYQNNSDIIKTILLWILFSMTIFLFLKIIQFNNILIYFGISIVNTHIFLHLIKST